MTRLGKKGQVSTPKPILDRLGIEPDTRIVTWASERCLPANDASIVAAAVAAEVGSLVTGDRTHFGDL